VALKPQIVIGFALVALIAFGCHADESLVIGQLTLVPASAKIPYAYWYYVPESALTSDVVGLVWHATPGGSEPHDPVLWAKFDLPHFLACSGGWAKPRVNLPELHGFVLFSVAVPEPPPEFYADQPGVALGSPVALNSLATFDPAAVSDEFIDPDLKALACIEDLKQRLTEHGIAFDARLFLTGVYSGAEWAHRFSVLHPTSVRAAAPVCGNMYTMPFAMLDSEAMPWPLGLSGFEDLGRGTLDTGSLAATPYYVTISAHERVWYNEMTPEEQGIDQSHLDRYVLHFGSIPPERAASFVTAWSESGYSFAAAWSEKGHGWIDAVRLRVFEFFASFALEATPEK
jgi:hypothetical protein